MKRRDEIEQDESDSDMDLGDEGIEDDLDEYDE